MSDLPQDDITAYFRAEVPGLLAELETGLLRLRQDHSRAAYYRLLRAAHSLKGGAASISMYSIQTLAQCLEDVFQTLLARPDTDIDLIEDLLLQGFDCLRLPLSQWLKTGVCDPDFALRRAKVIYEELTRLLGPVPQTMQPVTSADLEVDMVQTIFESDIAPKIAEIQQLLAQGTPEVLCGELRAQFDVLTGLGEMLNLPGLTRIGQAVMTALNLHPEQAKLIGEIAVRDLQAVMRGNHQEGEPSPELLAWLQPSGQKHNQSIQFAGNPAVAKTDEGQPTGNPPPIASTASPASLSLWDELGNELNRVSNHPSPKGNHTEPKQTTNSFPTEVGDISATATGEPSEPLSLGDEIGDAIAPPANQQFENEEQKDTTDLFGQDIEDIPPKELPEPSESLCLGDGLGDTTTTQSTHRTEAGNLTNSFWEEVGNASATESLSLWDEIGDETALPSSNQLGNGNDTEPAGTINSFWEELGNIPSPEPSPSAESVSFWDALDDLATPQPTDKLLNDAKTTNSTDSFWEELGDSSPTPATESLQPSLVWTGPPLPPSSELNLEALEFFAQEAQELLQELESGLLTLRQNQTIPHIHALMRAAHSIKGGAATVGLPVIQVIAHRLENALQTLYQWPGELDVPLEEALLQAFDTLRQPLQARLAGQEFTVDDVLQKAEQAFQKLEAILGATEPTGEDAYVPSSQDLGVDMTATIFSGDIQQGLSRFEAILAQPTGDWLTEITGQLEVFAHLGELVNLPGWRAICETGLQALAQHPEQAMAISQVILRDLRQGYTQVMAGEREHGGKVSAELQAFVIDNVQSSAVRLSEPEPIPPPGSTPVLTQANISTLFEQLPPATPEVTPVAETPIPSKTAASPSPSPRGASVRVEVSRLERLNNLIGELVIQENGSLLYQQQLQKLVQTFGQRLNKFEMISRALQDTADQLTLMGTQIRAEASEFDPLQMDSYNQLYTWVQTVIEEIAQVGEVMRDMSFITQQSQENLRKKQQTLKQIRGDLLWMRMVPLSEVFQRFPRMVRDLCVQYHKQVQVRLVGASTLVDKAVLEKISDPLVHLVRNAFDHGIEPPHVRQQKGKNPEGIIEIQAYYRGNQTYITVRDDGQGIDLERVRQKAVEKGLFTAEQAANATKLELLNCLFTPGFSTAATVSDLSGRGVGLDVVRLQIQALKGTIDIHTEPGQGTTFTIRLPLTLTITKLLVFGLERRWFALAVDSLAGIVTVNDAALVSLQGRQLYRWQERLVPLIPPSVLEYRYPVRWMAAEETGLTLPTGQGHSLLLLSVGNEVYGLEIDQILLEQDLVIKPFSSLLQPPTYVYGCTILGDGRLVPVLDAAGLVNHWLRTPTLGAVLPRMPARAVTQTELLVVDDSLTIRGMLSKTLTKHGYRVHTAADGREALELLAQNPQIKAVFSDIEMPRMNGFEFLSACRQDPRYRELPIIMLTSRAGDKHQKMAQKLGCSAYLTKPYLEPDLLRTLQQFLPAD
ncbi:Hpt domain-containing protein [Gloeomargarita sp.]